MPDRGILVLNLLFANDFILNSNLKFPVVRLSVFLDPVKQRLLKACKQKECFDLPGTERKTLESYLCGFPRPITGIWSPRRQDGCPKLSSYIFS